MQYTVEVAIAYSCDYNEEGAKAIREHGREYVEAMHKEIFREIFRDVEGLQLHSLCLDIVSPDDLFQAEQEPEDNFYMKRFTEGG